MKKNYLLIVLFFAFTAANAQLNKLLNFSDTLRGRGPKANLVSDGTYLYGMTEYGGTYHLGTVFKILPNGTGYTKLLNFKNDTIHGINPTGSLTYDGTSFYGTTTSGGLYHNGTIFKISPNGTYTKLFDLQNDGISPQGSLFFDGTYLYGTGGGGLYGDGVIFKILPNGTGFTTIYNFNSTGGPWSDLVSDGTFLYGMSYNGGVNGWGFIYKVRPNGTGYSKLLDFAGSNGKYPRGSLYYGGTFLYGTTLVGGANNLGTIFKIDTNGSGYAKLFDFGGSINGSSPTGGLISDGTFLYGLTSGGGAYVFGVIYKIRPNGTGFDTLVSLSDSSGNNPYGALTLMGNCFYGMGRVGGAYNDGTVFSYCSSGVGLETIDYEGVQVNVYPNPTSGQFTVETNIADKQTVNIFDANGKQMRSKIINGTTDIDVSDLSKGIYGLSIKSTGQVINKKLIIIR